MGHKSLTNTLRYVHLCGSFSKEDCIVKGTDKIDEAKGLLEQGFEYVTEMDNIKLFRKRK